MVTTGTDLGVWIFCHEYGPSSPEHVYKSPPCQGDKFCLPLKNQQLLHFLLLCRHCRPIILCDYAVPCIGDNVRRVNMSYRLSSLAGVGLDKPRPTLPHRSLEQVSPLLAKLGAGCVCVFERECGDLNSTNTVWKPVIINHAVISKEYCSAIVQNIFT